MKILVVTHYYNAHGGGVEIVAGNIIQTLLKKENIDITWIASDVDKPPAVTSSFRSIPMNANNYFENKFGVPYPLWGLRSLSKLFKAVKAADIVHIHDYAYFGNIAAFCAAKFYKKRIVITQHIGYIPYKNPIFRIILSCANRTIGLLMMRTSFKTVFISESVRKYFDMNNAYNTLFISNGVDRSLFYPPHENTRQDIRRKYSLPENDAVFLFAGRFVEKKGLPILKELARIFNNVTWIFVGWGAIDPETWGLKNVRVFRHIDKMKMPDFYRAADLTVLPSVGEGFPLVIQESMSCGTPVIVNREIIDAYPPAENTLFYADHHKINTWENRLKTLLSDAALSPDTRRRVADFAEQHWNWDKCANAYLSLFTQI
ncbi:MAG TPA: glycosyltransferase family 4 protein [Candidatus Omnitrophota bacterium]|nr:glycosyltransferase family 4 protein [Candidatus Omnitrophota bacterium]